MAYVLCIETKEHIMLLVIETTRKIADQEIIVRDFDHAMLRADMARLDPSVRRIALMRRNRVVAVVYDAINPQMDAM